MPNLNGNPRCTAAPAGRRPQSAPAPTSLPPTARAASRVGTPSVDAVCLPPAAARRRVGGSYRALQAHQLTKPRNRSSPPLSHGSESRRWAGDRAVKRQTAAVAAWPPANATTCVAAAEGECRHPEGDRARSSSSRVVRFGRSARRPAGGGGAASPRMLLGWGVRSDTFSTVQERNHLRSECSADVDHSFSRPYPPKT